MEASTAAEQAEAEDVGRIMELNVHSICLELNEKKYLADVDTEKGARSTSFRRVLPKPR